MELLETTQLLLLLMFVCLFCMWVLIFITFCIFILKFILKYLNLSNTFGNKYLQSKELKHCLIGNILILSNVWIKAELNGMWLPKPPYGYTKFKPLGFQKSSWPSLKFSFHHSQLSNPLLYSLDNSKIWLCSQSPSLLYMYAISYGTVQLLKKSSVFLIWWVKTVGSATSVWLHLMCNYFYS